MKNYPYYLLLIVVLLSATANAQTTWVTKKLDTRLSLKFPSEPTKTSGNGIETYTVKGADSIGYTAGVIDYNTVAHIDSATLSSLKDNQQFADQIKGGMAAKRTSYTFGDITIGKWKNYTIYNISGTENTHKNTVTMRMIVIGSKVYSIACVVPTGVVTQNKDLFLSSAELL